MTSTSTLKCTLRPWANNNLSYINALMEINGGLGRIRTPDPLIRSQVLYPTELPIRVTVRLDSAVG